MSTCPANPSAALRPNQRPAFASNHLVLSAVISSLLFWAATSASANASPVLTLWDHDQPLAGTTLSVGTVLFVGLADADANTLYDLELIDEAGVMIASGRLGTDGAGNSSPTFVMDDVVGCDPQTVEDPFYLRFATHQAAAMASLAARSAAEA